jgi:phage tail P2-like protein
MNDLNDSLLLLKVLPSHLIHHPEDQAMAQAVQAILAYVFKKSKVLDPKNEIPDWLLDTIASEKHVDFYDASLDIDTKRELINKALFFHRQKGTKGAVEELVQTVFGDGQVIEWFEYNGEPFHFKVRTNNSSATNEKALQFIRAIDSVKRKSAKLEKVEIIQTENLPLTFGAFLHVAEKLVVKQVI